MHEEANSVNSVPAGPVAASTVEQNNQNGLNNNVSIVTAPEMEIEVTTESDNPELDVNFTGNSEGKFNGK